MKKLQPEGRYKSLDNEMYEKMLKATAVFKLEIDELSAKYKFGQNITQERFEMILKSLKERATKKDNETVEQMNKFR